MSATSVQPWRTFTQAGMAIFIVTLDATIVFAAFPALWASFAQTSAGDVSWVLTAYTIVYAALLTPTSLALILQAFPSDKRSVAVSLWGLLAGWAGRSARVWDR